MRVWVTGGRGFVGAHLVPRLEQAGHTAIVTDREVDVADPAAVSAALDRAAPDAIIHLAAQSSVARSQQAPALDFRVNYLGTRALLQAVESARPHTRVLLVSSSDAYGPPAPDAPPRVETDALCPTSPYGRTKAAAELLGTLAAGRGRPVVRVRAFTHTGPGQADAFAASSFARQVAEIQAGRREPRLRVGNLDSVRDLLDVRDVVAAYVLLLDPNVPADVYNVARGDGVTMRHVVATLLSLAGVQADVEVDSALHRPTDHQVGDAARLAAATGWAPATPLEQTLADLLDDWRARVSA